MQKIAKGRLSYILYAAAALAAVLLSAARLMPEEQQQFSAPAVSTAAVASSTAAVSIEWPAVENKSFSQGECLEFNIRYGLLGVGTADMAVQAVEDFSSRSAYHVVVSAKSHPFFDTFYKVRNKDETWIDTRSICCLKAEKHQREGGYSRDELVVFDHGNKRYYQSQTNDAGVTNNREGDITPFIQDTLSALYRVRTCPLEVGKEYSLEAFSDNKVYPLKVCVYKKERVKVPAGKFDCIQIEPFVSGPGLFKNEGRLWIWVTDDDRKMPVLMKSKILVGSITAELKKYCGTN